MNKLEVLADAIAFHNNAHDISSEAYVNRNPGNLAAFSVKQIKSQSGRRVFLSILDGYQALLFDLRVKCSGKSRAGLPEQPKLSDLFKSYGQSLETAKAVAKRVRKVLNVTVTAETPLDFFLDKEPANARPE